MARLSAIWRGLLLSFRDFPVEAFISVSAFVLTLLSNEKVIETAFPLVLPDEPHCRWRGGAADFYSRYPLP